MSKQRRYIGCWFSAKKKKKVNLSKLQSLIEGFGAELKEIDISKSLKSQEPFDAIIHKMTDHMIDAMNGNALAEKNMKDVERYLNDHPQTIVVDPLGSIRKLLDRYETYKLIRSTKICHSGKLHIPTFIHITCRNKDVILEQMNEHNVEFPFVCKKSVAHGSASHKMSVIFNEDGLNDVDPPCVAQTFVNHGALLYKIYVIADKYHVVKRPSLRNFSKQNLKGHKTIFFNSHDISSGESSRSKLTTLDEEDVLPVPALDETVVHLLTKELHTELKMTMYGVDIIACPETGKQYVIDVNVFPGYDGVPDFLNILVEHIIGRIETTTTNGSNGDSISNCKQVEEENCITREVKVKTTITHLIEQVPKNSVICGNDGEPKNKVLRYEDQETEPDRNSDAR